MIQELIPGGGESQFSYTHCAKADGQSHHLLRGGPGRFHGLWRASTFVETVDDPTTSATAVRLIETLRYTGIVEVEFKRDPRDGKLKLLDINPRVGAGTVSVGLRGSTIRICCGS